MTPVEPTPAGTRGPLDTTTAPGPFDSGLGPADLDGADPGDPGGPTTGFDGDDRDGDEPQGKRRKPTWLVAVEWLLLIGGALALALLIKMFLFQAFYIPSESMVPTLQKNDRVLVNKLSYKLHDVHRGDIVVFEAPEGEASEIKDLVKRVIGLPGETLEARDGVVYVDGEPIDESYLPEGTRTEDLPPTTVPPETVFVMGDNRGASKDSRYFGVIPEDDIVGRVFVRMWPLSRLDFM
jgi:signal peptidase I